MISIHNVGELQALVKAGNTPEGLYLEFKARLERGEQGSGGNQQVPSPKDARLELCRDVVQFANADGGVLIFGVPQSSRDNLDVADGFAPLQDPERDRQWIDDALKRWVVPSTFHRQIEVLEVLGGRILAVNVEAALHPVAVLRDLDRNAVEYPYRLSSGRKAYMTPEDVAVRMVASQRAARLKLQKLARDLPQQPSVILSPRPQTRTWQAGKAHVEDSILSEDGRVSLMNLGEGEFALHVPIRNPNGGLTAHVPYGLVREAWRTSSGLIGIALSARIIWDARHGEFELEPL